MGKMHRIELMVMKCACPVPPTKTLLYSLHQIQVHRSLLEQSDKVEMMVSEWSCKLPATRFSVARFILLETEELGICSATQEKRRCRKRNHLGLERQEVKTTCKTINPLSLQSAHSKLQTEETLS